MTQTRSILFPLYPQVTQLDFTGPFEVLRQLPGARIVLASVEGGDLDLGDGLRLTGLTRLAQVKECFLLCVPGGLGITEALGDERLIECLRRLGQRAEYVTSVCTGSLLLGAAGLLAGKRAACHWAFRPLLSPLGATPDAARVVRDGRVITGGGVTAGIDLALAVAAELEGEDFARRLSLAIEYAPEPPFASGRPELCDPDLARSVERVLHARAAGRAQAVQRAAQNLAPHP